VHTSSPVRLRRVVTAGNVMGEFIDLVADEELALTCSRRSESSNWCSVMTDGGEVADASCR
jgi:hypothetical protein